MTYADTLECCTPGTQSSECYAYYNFSGEKKSHLLDEQTSMGNSSLTVKKQHMVYVTYSARIAKYLIL